MRRRILTAIVSMTLLGTLVLTIPLAVIISNRERDASNRELDRIAERTAARILERAGELTALPPVRHVERSVSVAVYDDDGDRISGKGPAKLDAAAKVAGVLTAFRQTDTEHVVA